jgi:surface protein
MDSPRVSVALPYAAAPIRNDKRHALILPAVYAGEVTHADGAAVRLFTNRYIPTILEINTALTAAGTTANNQFKLPLRSDGRYSFTVEWGDGTTDRINAHAQAQTTHTYPAPGVYQVTIKGRCNGMSFAPTGAISATPPSDYTKLITVLQWGTAVSWGVGAFCGCVNLDAARLASDNKWARSTIMNGAFAFCTFTQIPTFLDWDWSGVTDVGSLFQQNPNFNQNLNDWDVSGFSSMFGTFINCTAYNQPMNKWRFKPGASIIRLVSGCTSFNQNVGEWNIGDVGSTIRNIFQADVAFDNGGSDDIGNWNTGNATNVFELFAQALAFNRNIGAWDVSKITEFGFLFARQALGSPMLFNRDISGWNTSSALSMANMFNSNENFNQPIGSWNVEKVTNFSNMFFGATAFKQDLGNWWPKSATNMSSMFLGMDMNAPGNYDNYEALLVGWTGWSAGAPSAKGLALKTGVNFNAGNARLRAGTPAAEARAWLAKSVGSGGKGWTITDSGFGS